MTCKDCLHYEACTDMIESLGHTLGGDGPNAEKRCKCFTDRSEWVRLPNEEYTFTVRGDIALGVIIANCRAAEAEKALEGTK